ncbi:MAG: hypothetical protein ACRDS9_16600 [Pseudonocardiaceae bacterium]
MYDAYFGINSGYEPYLGAKLPTVPSVVTLTGLDGLQGIAAT